MQNTDYSVCAICGKTYKTCLSCKNMKTIRPWRSITDTIDCYKIFMTISEYSNGHITKEEARRSLESMCFDTGSLKASVQNKIAEIMEPSAQQS